MTTRRPPIPSKARLRRLLEDEWEAMYPAAFDRDGIPVEVEREIQRYAKAVRKMLKAAYEEGDPIELAWSSERVHVPPQVPEEVRLNAQVLVHLALDASTRLRLYFDDHPEFRDLEVAADVVRDLETGTVSGAGLTTSTSGLFPAVMTVSVTFSPTGRGNPRREILVAKGRFRSELASVLTGDPHEGGRWLGVVVPES